MNNDYIAGIGRLKLDTIPFIFFRRLVKIGREEFSRIVGNLFNRACNRDTVYMNIENRHENADFDCRFPKRVVVMINLLNLDDFPIGRRQYCLIRGIHISVRVSEEEDGENGENGSNER